MASQGVRAHGPGCDAGEAGDGRYGGFAPVPRRGSHLRSRGVLEAEGWENTAPWEWWLDKLDIKPWADCVVKWDAEDPYSPLTKAVSALTPLFPANVILSRKLARMIEARQKEQKKKQNRQETIAEAKQLKKD
ncbi:small integral membrane protein 15-like [Mustela nigripes]|uniref:small integral membrane protein 15-like n=1 Tax=Mustela nigripes TaxID=77151 RepID=UPI0028150390|nr:small integral membrane protein 15-like [Mustela nigripes]